MQRQGSFAEGGDAGKKKQTRRDKFLAEMEQAVPWPRLVARLAPLYPKGERGRPPIPLERMLRVYFVQQWYGLADQGRRMKSLWLLGPLGNGALRFGKGRSSQHG